jgi:ribosome-binding factor A
MAHRPFTQDRVSHRPARFAQRVQEELMQLVPKSLKDPRVSSVMMLTITSVDLSPDYKHATVLFTLSEQDRPHFKDIEKGLNSAAGFLRRELMLRIQTKITPQLVFKYDKGLENTTTIDSLLKQFKKDEDEQK